ncbi:hypothetical protein [Shewanella hanedai]|nr:hypothetical protein [Shewanella hanedai]
MTKSLNWGGCLAEIVLGSSDFVAYSEGAFQWSSFEHAAMDGGN